MIAVPRLLERDGALEAIDLLLARAIGGEGGAVMIVGAPGTGKTTLLARTADVAAVHTTKVRWARGASPEAELAFAYVEQIVGEEPLLGVEEPFSASRREVVYETVVSSVHAWAESGPVLLCLDDLQWADPDSLSAVGYLARRLAGRPVALVAAMRSWPEAASSLAQSLEQGGRALRLDLHPLSRSSTGELIHQLLGRPSPETPRPGVGESELLERAWRLTRGNPLLVHEAAHTISEDGGLPDLSGAGGAEVARMQRTLLLSHLVGLSAEALECARAAAVLGSRSRIQVIEQMVGMQEASFADAFDSLVASGVLLDAGGGCVEFSHDLLAAAIYDDMGPGRRRALHARAFSHYAIQSDVAAGATHALAADLAGDQRAIDLVSDAGRRAIAEGAIGTGVTLLQAAVRLAGGAAPDELLTRLADAQFAADRPDAALATYRQLLEMPKSRRARIDILAKAARAQAYSGDLDQAISMFDRALEESETLPAPEAEAVLGGLLAARAHLAWERDGPVAGLEVLDPSGLGGRLAENQSPQGQVARDRIPQPLPRLTRWPSPEPPMLDALRGFFTLKTGDRSGAAAVEAAAEAARRRIAGQIELDSAELVASFNILLLHPAVCVALERLDEAAELVAHARKRFQQAGSVRSTVALATASMLTMINQGAFREAVAEADFFEKSVGSDRLGGPRLVLLKAEALTWLGRVEESRAACDVVEADGLLASQFSRLSLGVARAHHLAEAGRASEAARAYLELEELAHLVGIGSMLVPLWAAGAIEAALDAGAHAAAARVAAWLEERNQSLGCTWPRMLALAARAGVAAAEGDARARPLYEDALSASSFLPLSKAVIQVRFGGWLRRCGDIARARAVLAEAVGVAEDHGAAPLGARASAELSAAGGRRRRTRDSSALSPQEARVAALAATGATTREIAGALYLSPRTVDSHLSHVFAKLGLRSRHELRQRRSELGI